MSRPPAPRVATRPDVPEAPEARREPKQKHGGLRLDVEVKARLRALPARMSTPWYRATHSDAMRAVILAGLPIVEATYPPTADEARPRRKPRPSK